MTKNDLSDTFLVCPNMVNNFHFRLFQQITELGNTDCSQCVLRSSLTNKTNTIFKTGVKRTDNKIDKRNMTNNDLQNTTQKAEHRVRRTPLKAHYYNPSL